MPEAKQPRKLPGAALILAVGRPASGKSYLGRLIAERLGARLVQTDAVRKAMFDPPRYTAREHAAVYARSRALVERTLRQGQPVVFDATNLKERPRRLIYAIADRADVPLLIVATYAPPQIILERLRGRQAGRDPLDQSDADWAVYQRLGRLEPITRPHIIVNTVVDLEPVLALIAARAAS